MPITDVFSKRLRQSQGDVPDVYVYDTLPEKLRVQLVQIMADMFDSPRDQFGGDNEYCSIVHRLVCREHGRFSLGEKGKGAATALCQHLMNHHDIPDVLDVIEVTYQVAEGNKHQLHIQCEHAIAELSRRFRENGVGYQYVSGQIVRVDAQVTHETVVKPGCGLADAA